VEAHTGTCGPLMNPSPVPDCAEAVFRATEFGELVTIGLWFQLISPPVNPTNLQTLAERCASLFRNAGPTGTLSADCTFVNVVAQDFSTGPGITATSTNTPRSGLNGPGSINHIASRLSVHTTPERVNHRSSIWMFGVPVSKVSGNLIDVAWSGGVALSMANFIVNLPIFGWRWVSVSRIASNAPRTPPDVRVVTEVTSNHPIVSNLRRRSP